MDLDLRINVIRVARRDGDVDAPDLVADAGAAIQAARSWWHCSPVQPRFAFVVIGVKSLGQPLAGIVPL